MRLLVISQYFWPEEFRINDLTAELVARGHDVTVLTGLPNYPDGALFKAYSEDRAKYSSYEGARVVRVPLVLRGRGGARLLLNYLSFAVSASLLGSLRLRGQKFDAIFIFEPSPVTIGIPGAVLRFLKKAPSSIWVLDLWPETLEAIGVVRSPFLLRIIGRVVSWIYRHCDLILAQSHSFIPQIEKYSGSTPVAYFPNWADSIFRPGDTPPAPEVPAENGRFNIMFAGNIGDAQDFPTILSAAELLKSRDSSVRWLIVGDGRAAAWVHEEIARRNLQDTVLMLGRHPVDRMPAFYKSADVLFLALRDEPIFAMTIPGKVQSYMASGMPLIAMINGEGADVIRRAQCGLTCPAGNAKALADTVAKMKNLSAAERAQMGVRARTFSEQEFDRARQISQLEDRLAKLGVQNP